MIDQLAHTSSSTSSWVHCMATLPSRLLGVDQSETSTERTPSTLPSPVCAKSKPRQNWRWEIEVSAHSESM